MFNYLRGVCLLLAIGLLSACASNHAQLSDGSSVEIVSVNDGAAGVDASLIKTKTRTPSGGFQSAYALETKRSIDGELVLTAVGTVVPTAINAATGYAIADMKADCGDNCGGNQFYIGGGTAVAGSESNSGAVVNNEVRNRQSGGGGGCPSCKLGN